MARERRQEEDDERDARERGPAAQERPAAVAGREDAEEEEQPAQADGQVRVAAKAVAEPGEREHGAAHAAAGLDRNARAQVGGDAGHDRGVGLGQRAADQYADVGEREGEALRTLREHGGVDFLRGAPEAGAEGVRADDGPGRSDEKRAIRREIALLRDHLIDDPLRHVSRHAGVAQAERRVGAERARIEDHALGVEQDRPGREQDRASDAQGRGRPLPEPIPVRMGHGRSSERCRP